MYIYANKWKFHEIRNISYWFLLKNDKIDFCDLSLREERGFLAILDVELSFGLISLVFNEERVDVTEHGMLLSDTDVGSEGLSIVVAVVVVVVEPGAFRTLNMVLMLLRVEKSDK